MGKERNFYLILIFVYLFNGIRADSKLKSLISDRIQPKNGNFDDKIEKLEIKLNNKFENLESKIDRLENSIKKLTEISEALLNRPSASNQAQTSQNHQFDKHFNCIKNCVATSQTPKSCEEILANESNKDGVYLLHLKYLEPFGAYCLRKNNTGWTIIQRRVDGLENFYRNWSDYKNGFGNLNGNYWLGLKRLNILTSTQDYELHIFMQSRDNTELLAKYSEFHIDSEDKGYRLSATGYSGTAEDALFSYNGNEFSTFAEPNETTIHDTNCVQQTMSAWWYGGQSCGYDKRYSSLNGEYRPYTDDGKGIFWWSKGRYHSLQYLYMAIRPADSK